MSGKITLKQIKKKEKEQDRIRGEAATMALELAKIICNLDSVTNPQGYWNGVAFYARAILDKLAGDK